MLSSPVWLGLIAILFALTARGAPRLHDYAGTYSCSTLMQVRPTAKPLANASVVVTATGGNKVRVEIKDLDFSLLSGEMSNGIRPGDFEFRSGGPVRLVSLSEMVSAKYLSFTYDGRDRGITGAACARK